MKYKSIFFFWLTEAPNRCRTQWTPELCLNPCLAPHSPSVGDGFPPSKDEARRKPGNTSESHAKKLNRPVKKWSYAIFGPFLAWKCTRPSHLNAKQQSFDVTSIASQPEDLTHSRPTKPQSIHCNAYVLLRSINNNNTTASDQHWHKITTDNAPNARHISVS